LSGRDGRDRGRRRCCSAAFGYCNAVAASSRFDLGWGNAATNLAIAALKALLILLVFMQLRANRGLPRLVAGATAFWLGILYVLTFADYATR
jgi:cytochrome c oxidase subunit 4